MYHGTIPPLLLHIPNIECFNGSRVNELRVNPCSRDMKYVRTPRPTTDANGWNKISGLRQKCDALIRQPDATVQR